MQIRVKFKDVLRTFKAMYQEIQDQNELLNNALTAV